MLVAIHSFQEKMRYNVLRGLWDFPGTRFELIAEWRLGKHPESHYLVLDAQAMPPRWSRTTESSGRGVYTTLDATWQDDRKIYYQGMNDAVAVIEVGEHLSLSFADSKERFRHPVVAPRCDEAVPSDHPVWKCPDRRWLRAFVRGQLELPDEPFHQIGDARWIESHLARCHVCFLKAAQMSRSIPCPDASARAFLHLYDGLRYDVEFHRAPGVCGTCKTE